MQGGEVKREYDWVVQNLDGLLARHGYQREGGESFNAIWYSYTDYQDCASEEAFQDTVQRWYYRTKQVPG